MSSVWITFYCNLLIIFLYSFSWTSISYTIRPEILLNSPNCVSFLYYFSSLSFCYISLKISSTLSRYLSELLLLLWVFKSLSALTFPLSILFIPVSFSHTIDIVSSFIPDDINHTEVFLRTSGGRYFLLLFALSLFATSEICFSCWRLSLTLLQIYDFPLIFKSKSPKGLWQGSVYGWSQLVSWLAWL